MVKRNLFGIKHNLPLFYIVKYSYLALSIVLVLMCGGCVLLKKHSLYKTPTLEIEEITPHTFLHRSYLATEKWGKVGCNGLVYINEREAIVFDTPVNDSTATELIDWVTKKKKAKLVGVVVNHFHADCLGGLRSFHNAGIPSYSSELTRKLAEADTANNPEVPQNGFHVRLLLKVGNETTVSKYLGEAHTRDNIVSYIPSEKVLFGGCMVKELNAGKGNVADANEHDWPNTIGRVMIEFADAKYVIPGHGKYGDTSLLTYTYRLFTR